jgi:hypothetical protein
MTPRTPPRKLSRPAARIAQRDGAISTAHSRVVTLIPTKYLTLELKRSSAAAPASAGSTDA